MTAGNGNGGDAKEITIEELLQRIDGATGGMSASNPNRLILEQCRVAIVYLAQRVPDERLTHGRIIAP